MRNPWLDIPDADYVGRDGSAVFWHALLPDAVRYSEMTLGMSLVLSI